MSLWNVRTALQSPNGRTRNLNIPRLVTKDVLSASAGDSAQCEKRQLPANASKH